MKYLLASIMKDIRLFIKGTGIISILLPMLLLVALQLGGSNLTQQAYIKPFSIAIRDNDNTIMSGSLIQQIKEIEMFSEVIVADEQDDNILLNQGCAAVVTIPKNFFYDMYSMKQMAVPITLNEDMPLESALFESVFSSIVEIIGYEQAVAKVEFSFCYGELSNSDLENMWKITSQRLLEDALGRHLVFDEGIDIESMQKELNRNFFSCAISLLCLFFSFSAARTLPSELYSGILPRYIAAGGNKIVFFISKLITAILVSIPAMILLIAVFSPQRIFMVVLLSIILFISSFGIFIGIVALSKTELIAQRWSNFIIMCSLLFGGAIYGYELLPKFVQVLGSFTIPYYAKIGLNVIDLDINIFGLIKKMLPILVIGLIFTIIAVFRFSNKNTRDKYNFTILENTVYSDYSYINIKNSNIKRILELTYQKIKIMSGGIKGIIYLIFIIGICGIISSYALEKNTPSELNIAVVSNSNGFLANELIESIDDKNGVSLKIVSETNAKKLLEGGYVEGILYIKDSYDTALYENKEVLLSYKSAATSSSNQIARELIASVVVRQEILIRGLSNIESYLGRNLFEEEKKQILSDIKSEMKSDAELYEKKTEEGNKVSLVDPFSPKQIGFVTFAIMMTLFTWSVWVSNTDAKLVENRMTSVKNGFILSYSSDVLSLFFIGCIVGISCILPSSSINILDLVTIIIYTWCVTGFSIILVRYNICSGRIDVLAPFLVLITCFIGGCFGSISEFSPILKFLSLCTPQGLAMYAQAGNLFAIFILFVLGCVLLFFGISKNKLFYNK